MDESMVVNVIGAGIGLAVIDRLADGGSRRRRKRKTYRLKRLSEK
jgi:hypothetical protein